MPTSVYRPSGNLESLLERVIPLVRDGDAFRFLTEPRRREYLVILYALLGRRMAHEVEVYHDELRDEVEANLRESTGRAYDMQDFRSAVEQLRRWGNLSERVEPTRIRSLADRGRSKLLLRIDSGTAALLQFLEAQAEPSPLGLRDRGANLLADIHTSLREAVQCLREASRVPRTPTADGGAPSERVEKLVLRSSHLIRESDARAEEVARELVAFSDQLSRFVTEPFQVQELAELGSWLERYVERYLEGLEENGRAIRRALTELEKSELAPLLAKSEERERERLAATPDGLSGSLRLRGAREIVAGLRSFFDINAGLAQQCRRIHRNTREAIRRIQRYVEAVRLRNVRIETIRARLAELFDLSTDSGGEARASLFIEELVAPVAVRTDARPGTSTAKSAPPRPTRRYESHRPAFRGGELEGKRSTAKESRELDRQRLESLSRFIDEHLLRGRDQAPISETELESLDDARKLVAALSAYLLRGGKARKVLDYRFDRPRHPGRAVIESSASTLDLPAIQIERKLPS